MLCIRRSLAYGRRLGFISGLGAASADAFYGAIAGFGLSFISQFLIAQQEWLRLGGGLFLIYLGLRTVVARTSQASAVEQERPSLRAAFASTFFLTITNPLTILSFAAIFAGLGLAAHGGSTAGAIVLVLGVFLGSTAWWFLLSGMAGLLGSRVTPSSLMWVNRISGLLILAFGVAALASLL